MKKIFFLSFSLLMLCQISFAQNTSELSKKEYNKTVFLQSKNTISFSPFNLALSQGVLSYERRFGNKNSLVFQNSFNLFSNKYKERIDFFHSFKFNSEIQYRRYLSYFQLRKKKFPDTKNAMGVYIAPIFNYEYGEQHSRNLDSDFQNWDSIVYTQDKFYNAVQGGVLAGINFDIIYGKLSVQLNLGAAYKHSWVVYNISHDDIVDLRKVKPGIMAYGYTGFVPKVNFQLGYNF